MTCKEKLTIEHPGKIMSSCKGGCAGCPHDYGYMPDPEYCPKGTGKEPECTECWRREIPGTEKPRIMNSKIFAFVEVTDDWMVVYHRETKVMYAVSVGSHNRGRFTVLVNPDGTPLLYRGE